MRSCKNGPHSPAPISLEAGRTKEGKSLWYKDAKGRMLHIHLGDKYGQRDQPLVQRVSLDLLPFTRLSQPRVPFLFPYLGFFSLWKEPT